MNTPLSPDLEAKAQELAQDILQKSHQAALEIARRLVAVPDENLFGQTEFDIRDETLKIVGHAYNAHLGSKKKAT